MMSAQEKSYSKLNTEKDSQMAIADAVAGEGDADNGQDEGAEEEPLEDDLDVE